MSATVTADFGIVAAQPQFTPLHRGWIRIQRLGESTPGVNANIAELAACGVTMERAFCRPDQHYPTPWSWNNGSPSYLPKTAQSDPSLSAQFTMSDEWAADMVARGVEPLLICERWPDWWRPTTSTPITATMMDTWEHMWYLLVKHFKTLMPAARIVEGFNEPDIANIVGNLPDDIRVEFLVRNLRVVQRVNALNLPGPKLVGAGPALTATSFGSTERYKGYIDAMAAHPDWPTVKPDWKYLTLHSFSGGVNLPRQVVDRLDLMRAYEAATADGTFPDDLRSAVTASSMTTGGDKDASLDSRDAARWSVWQAPFWAACRDGEVEFCTAFCERNYNNQLYTLLWPSPVGSGAATPAYGQPGVPHPAGNVCRMYEMVAQAGGVRVSTVATGQDAAKFKGDSKTDGEAVRSDGAAWLFVWDFHSGLSGSVATTVQLAGLAACGIANTDTPHLEMWRVDATTSNAASGGVATLQKVYDSPVGANPPLSAGAIRTVNLTVGFNSLWLMKVTPNSGAPVAQGSPVGVAGVVRAATAAARRLRVSMPTDGIIGNVASIPTATMTMNVGGGSDPTNFVARVGTANAFLGEAPLRGVMQTLTETVPAQLAGVTEAVLTPTTGRLAALKAAYPAVDKLHWCVPLNFDLANTKTTANQAKASTSFEAIAAGSWDPRWPGTPTANVLDYYVEMADQMATMAPWATHWIRLGWECNGTWYAWGFANNIPAWISAYRSVALAIKTLGHANLKFTWNISLGPYRKGYSAAHSAWPGDDVVDDVGLDYYHRPMNGDPYLIDIAKWAARYGNHLDRLHAFAVAHGKTFSMPEWGCGGANVRGLEWLRLTAQWMALRPTSGPGSISYHSWFSPTSGKGGDTSGATVQGIYDIITPNRPEIDPSYRLIETQALFGQIFGQGSIPSAPFPDSDPQP